MPYDADALRAENGRLRMLLEDKDAKIAELEERVARLERLLSRNSGNSSMPPSTDDLPGRKPPERRARRGGGRKPGKQPGAPGAYLAWSQDPDTIVDHFPRGRCMCGADLSGAADLGVRYSHQVTDLPEARAETVQHDRRGSPCRRPGYCPGSAAAPMRPANDPLKPSSWSAPKNFLASMPPIIADTIGNGFWVDMWVICDHVNCYLFSSDDNGHLYRSQTTVKDFPNGFGNTVIAMQDPNRFALFEASNVYKVKGTDRYLLDVEAIGSDGRRYFRSWTSTALDGQWTPLADTEANPFIRSSNVTFSPGVTPWTQDFSHGEMIRSGVDQNLTIDPCHLQFLYQGEDPSASGDYSQLPWRLGLLTQTNSTC